MSIYFFTKCLSIHSFVDFDKNLELFQEYAPQRQILDSSESDLLTIFFIFKEAYLDAILSGILGTPYGSYMFNLDSS